MWRGSATLIALVMAGALPANSQSSAEGWTRVRDPALGLRLEYPSKIFASDAGKTERHMGRRFRTSDGRAEFAYYSFKNDGRETPKSYLERTLVIDRRKIIYQRLTDRFFVVSSVRDKRIFYSRCNFGGLVRCIYLEYPQTQKRNWDRTVTRISNSLR